MRENQDDRWQLLEHYRNALLEKGSLVNEISGTREERIQKAIEANKIASELYDSGKIRESAIKYAEASELNPLEYTYFENAGITNFQFGYFEEAIPFLQHVVDSINPGTGKSEFVLAQVYKELGDLDKACEYIYASSRFDYKESFRKIGEYCIDNN